jgi:hypothetical protein
MAPIGLRSNDIPFDGCLTHLDPPAEFPTNMSLQNAYVRLNVKWAGKLGTSYAQYRPAGGTNPLASANQIGALPALFDASISLAFDAPSKFANGLFAAILNPTSVQPLDYLVGQEGTFFVASTEPLKPILCVQCNRVCTFSRPTPLPASPSFYGGDDPSARVSLATAVPCSQLQGTKGERDAADQLPTDSRMQWSEIIVPAFNGLILRQADRFSDDIGRNFLVSACELTQLGWRLTAELTDA